MGETIGAIGYKTDVKTRAKDTLGDKTQAIKDKVGAVTGRANEATPSGDEMKEGATRAVGVAQENPVGLALGAVGIGFVAGMLVPSTRVEDEKIGPLADQVKDKARETGGEALERGKQVAQQAAQSATETAQEAAREESQELATSVQEKAQEVRS
jgi:gas vesicle protein